MGRWLEAARRYSDGLTKPTELTKPGSTPATREVLSVKSVLSEALEWHPIETAQMMSDDKRGKSMMTPGELRTIRELTTALHEAIASPKGVVPDSAAPFYDQNHPALRRRQ